MDNEDEMKEMIYAIVLAVVTTTVLVAVAEIQHAWDATGVTAPVRPEPCQGEKAIAR